MGSEPDGVFLASLQRHNPSSTAWNKGSKEPTWDSLLWKQTGLYAHPTYYQELAQEVDF